MGVPDLPRSTTYIMIYDSIAGEKKIRKKKKKETDSTLSYALPLLVFLAGERERKQERKRRGKDIFPSLNRSTSISRNPDR